MNHLLSFIGRYINHLVFGTISFPGHHIRHIQLSYTPAMYHAITVTASGHLLVAEYDPPAIHVHSMQGDHLTTIQHREFELQGEDLIQGIRCSSDGMLHVATGVDCIDSLHAYKVGSGTDEHER